MMDDRSRPLKLLVVVPAYEPAWAFGGVVRAVSNLCRALARQGVDVSVYTTNVDGAGGCLAAPVSEPVSVGGVTVTYFPSGLGPSPAWASRQMQHTLEETVSTFDAVYVAAVWQWMGISAGRTAHRRNIPYVVSPHGSFLPAALRRSRVRKLGFWHGFLGRCVEAAAGIQFTTEYERRGCKPFLPAKASFVAPNPVFVDNGHLDEEAGGPGLRRRLGIPPDRFVLLTVTRAHPDKRLDVVIEALASMRGAGHNPTLLVVGPFDNRYGDRLKTLAGRLRVSDSIIWAGYQTGATLAAYYRTSDLFVLPSAHENFCMAVAEAMACGLPIVISRHVGIADDVERHGAGLITDINGEHVARAIQSIMTDSHRRCEMAQGARDAAARLYDGRRVAGLVLRAFQDILSGTRSPECAWQ